MMENDEFGIITNHFCLATIQPCQRREVLENSCCIRLDTSFIYLVLSCCCVAKHWVERTR